MNIKPYSGLVAGVIASTVIVSPARSADAQVVDLDISPESTGLQVQLAIADPAATAPQLFTVSRNNETITDIANTTFDLGDRQKFTQQDPMPGITSIEITQVDPENVRIVAIGENSAPTGEILSQDGNNLIFNLAIAENSTLVAQNTPAENTVTPPVSPEPEILFPDPQIPIEGKPSPASTDNFLRPSAPLPPFLPRASAPPVGDISVSTIDTSLPNYVDLGTASVVPRLVLREAPVQDVLTLLSRSANLNVVFADSPSSSSEDGSAVTSSLASKTISLDLENEPIQDVFNYVLMLSDLKATMRGRTIFVGTALPNAITPKITRSFRLNQVKVEQARSYLETGKSGITRTRTTTATGGSEDLTVTISSTQATAATAAAATTAGEGEGVNGLKAMFAGLEILTDERLNAITLTGEPKVVEIASNLLTQLDARKRQVAVNVKILDVSLSGNRSISSDLKLLLEDRVGISAQDGIILSPNDLAKATQVFGAFNEDGITVEQGNTQVSLGEQLEAFDSPVPENTTFVGPIAQAYQIAGLPVPAGLNLNQIGAVIQTLDDFGIPRSVVRGLGADISATSVGRGTNFIGQLVAGLLTNSTNKVVADPTLIIQEGELANISIDEDIIAGTTSTVIPISDNQNTVVTEPNIEKVGLIVDVLIDSIDDNGFITLNVNPTLSGVGEIRQITTTDPTTGVVIQNDVALKRNNSLTSGLVRLRDDQTLILAGLVREESNTTTSKVPLLGDIPIIGSLFRSSSTSNNRRELLFIITPQIIDDSQNATWGYGYTPSNTAREMLGNENFPTQNRF